MRGFTVLLFKLSERSLSSITRAEAKHHLRDRQFVRLVVIVQQFQQEDLVVEHQMKGREQKMLPFLNPIACRAHWVYGIPKSPKIIPEFVEIQFAGTNPELSKIG